MFIISMVYEPNGTSYFFSKDMQKKRENLGTVFYRNLVYGLWWNSYCILPNKNVRHIVLTEICAIIWLRSKVYQNLYQLLCFKINTFFFVLCMLFISLNCQWDCLCLHEMIIAIMLSHSSLFISHTIMLKNTSSMIIIFMSW